jgi:hydrophobe/amphiphile efflux-3 (HAE3) family protein
VARHTLFVMRNLLARIAAWAVERPAPVIALTVLVTLIAAVGALSLEADRNPDSLVDQGSSTFDATQGFYDQFGDEPVRVLVQGNLKQILLTDDLSRLLALESCLSGSAPGGQVFGPNQAAPPACARLAELKPADVVFGPATFLNQSAIAADKLYAQAKKQANARALLAARKAAQRAKAEGLSQAQQVQIAQAAAAEVQHSFQQQTIQTAVKYGLSGPPSINDPTYVEGVVFDPSQNGVPKARFNFLFPSSDSALISARLKPGLSQSDREQAISLFRAAVADPSFHLRGGTYTVSGVPVIFDGLAKAVSDQIFILLAVALAVMALTLTLVFGPPLRLLPLALALAAAAITFGLLAVVGGSLTMASIAVLPVLTGLAVDYAIQFQARFVEAARGGSSPARAAVEAAYRGGPMIATAGLATAAGLLVLVLSPIPMVRGFGLLLVLGIALAFTIALTAGLATLSMARRPKAADGSAPPSARGGARWSATTARWRVRRSAASVRLGRWGRQALAVSLAGPGRVLAVALVLAVTGWIAGTQTKLISDIRELLPANLPELQDVDKLESVTGQSGDVYVTVKTPDLSDPALIAWMSDFEQRVLSRHGVSDPAASCHTDSAEVCPGASLGTLFADQAQLPDQAQINRILGILPDYFAQALFARDDQGPGGTAVIGFGIKVMPFDEQKALIDDIRAQIDPPGTEGDPPAGVTAQVVGLPVLAADANSALSSNRYVLTLAGLLAVALVLLAIYRSFARALVPLIPIVLATGWSSLVIAAAGVDLNPMSATLGALVIAIATEFSVILSARYYEERGQGRSVGEALRTAYSRTGAAVAASGITAIAGFAVLALAAPIEAIFGGDPVRMLTDFGLVTVVDLAVALAGVMLALPAALVWAEGGFEPLPRLAERLRGRGVAATADGG